jgi:hypothetical protein
VLIHTGPCITSLLLCPPEPRYGKTHQASQRPIRAQQDDATQCYEAVTKPVTLGEVFLEAITSGVITDTEIAWVARNQDHFSRAEEATALRLGRLLDAGVVNPGCRIPSRLLHHRQIAIDWIEPLGRRRRALASA